jgi:hypothetical protein
MNDNFPNITIADWLVQNELQQFTDLFIEQEITMETLLSPSFGRPYLREVGLDEENIKISIFRSIAEFCSVLMTDRDCIGDH